MTPWIIEIFLAIGVTVALLLVLRPGYDNLTAPT